MSGSTADGAAEHRERNVSILLASLEAVSARYPTAPKLLLTPSLLAGHQVLEDLARAAGSWLNLAPITPPGLARRILDPGIEVLEQDQVTGLLEEVLDGMRSRDTLSYFLPIDHAEDLPDLLAPMVTELRLAGVSSAQVVDSAFVDPVKGAEIREILSGYEQLLEDRGLVDSGGLYTLALEHVRGNGFAGMREMLLIPELLDAPPLARELLKEIMARCRHETLPSDPVLGRRRPRAFHFVLPEPSDVASPFSWLFSTAAMPTHLERPRVQMFRAYGAANEVREVFRRIVEDGLSADSVLICHTDSGTYVPLLCSLAETLGVPVTVAGGIPLTHTRPGRLAMGLITWLAEDWPSSLLYRLLAAGLLSVERPMALAKVLRQAGIGWGRDRYIPRLEALEAEIRTAARELLEEGEPGRAEARERMADTVSELRDILELILKTLDGPDGTGIVSLRQMALGLGAVLEDYCRVAGDLDAAGREAVLDRLRTLAAARDRKLGIVPALRVIESALAEVRIGSSRPAPGHVHAAGPRQALWTQRPATFVVGLDAGRFPGAGLSDPLLLDDERALISGDVRIRSEAPEDNTYLLAALLASRRGSVVLSFSCHDVGLDRPSSPSPILLQAHRLATGCEDADYSDLVQALGDPVTYGPRDPGRSLDEVEWWLESVLPSGPAARKSLEACYPAPARGLHALEMRGGESLTAFDGLVNVIEGVVDPRVNHGLVLSASGLECLASCPFEYLLKYILRIRPPEEMERDAGVWLDPLARGSLLHDIYAAYLRQVIAKGAPSIPDRELLLRVADEATERMRDEIPPPSEGVYEYERRELLRGLDVFLKVEEELVAAGSIPVWLEVPFGLGQEMVDEAGTGCPDPVAVSLPGGGMIFLRGKIDRIDRLPVDWTFRIWDYKTGSTYGFDDGQYVSGGRQIQHVVYGAVAERILTESTGRKVQVVDAGYIFPTERGEGQRFLRDGALRDTGLATVDLLLDLVASGAFPATRDGGRCGYCDMAAACGGKVAVKRMQLKMTDGVLAPWREVEGHV